MRFEGNLHKHKYTHTHTHAHIHDIYMYMYMQGSAKYLPQLAWNHVVIEHRSAGRVYTSTDAVSNEYSLKALH